MDDRSPAGCARVGRTRCGLSLGPIIFALVAASGCADDRQGGSAPDSVGPATRGGAGSTSATSTAGTTGGGDESTSTNAPSDVPPPVALCERIAISLVLNRQAPVYDPASRSALRAFFDAAVEQTGAEVVILPNVGAETTPTFECDLGFPSGGDGLAFAWGAGFTPEPAGPEQLACVLDAALHSSSAGDADGDWMFSGLMFPILEHAWPPPQTDVTLAMLLGKTDDAQGGMYARPGMTAEAFLRLAGAGDRRRIAALTLGRDADELPMFAVSTSVHGKHYELGTDDLTSALPDYLPQLVEACRDHDVGQPPRMPGGCEHLDVVFVIDGSVSMQQEQAALRGEGGPPVFADFTDALVAALPSLEDFRVAVVSSQPGDHLFHTHRDQPDALPSAVTDCGVSPAEPWLTGPSPTLADDFACLASTRAETIHVEATAGNAALALTDPLNAGFLRDDSVVLVVLLTDEDTQDWQVDLTRMQVRGRILDAVGGDLARLFVLGIGGSQGVFEMPRTTCNGVYGTASPGRQLSSIAFSFRDHGQMQDICEGGLAEVFAAVLEDVIDTCDDFHPVP